jgi:hypothetical protein
MNLYSKEGLIWWVGVVEDRYDPLQLGRCKIRIFGYHTQDQNVLDTRDLPWAVPLQPITSAATSGIGSTPIGPVEGSWVVGWFLDGKDMQQPMFIGTIGAFNKENPLYEKKVQLKKASKYDKAETGNYLKDSSGNTVRDSFGEPIRVEGSQTNSTTYPEISKTLPPLSVDQLKTVMNLIAEKESSSFVNGAQNYTAENNKFGYIGKYQFGAAALYDLGYVKVSDPKKIKNSDLDDPNVWTNKLGINSKTAFLNSGEAQEIAMFQLMEKNYNTLKRLGKVTASDDPAHVAGLLATSHLLGAGNADKFDVKDGNGVRGKTYYEFISKGLGGEGLAPKEQSSIPNRESYVPPHPDNEAEVPTGPLNDPSLSFRKGFEDPNKVYPRGEYANRTDVNKLATGDKTHSIFNKKENKRTVKIQTAGGEDWDQPPSTFAGAYPFNQVIETEAGHVIEIDSSPGKERLHVYHTSGTFIEVDVNGTMVRKVVGENYEVFDRNNFTYVKGSHNLTVDGATKILIKDNATIYVDGNTTLFGYGNTTVSAAGTLSAVAETALVNSQNIDIVAEESLRLQAKNLSVYASESMAVRTNKDLTLHSTERVSIRSGVSVGIDTAMFKLKSGLAKTAAKLSLPIISRLNKKTPDTSQIPVLDTPLNETSTFLYDEAEKEAKDHASNLLTSGEIIPNVPKASNVAVISSGASAGTDCDCTELSSYTVFPDSLKLSTYFTLGSLSTRTAASSYAVSDYEGLRAQDIVCNLKNLAVNCLDPIKRRYPDMIVTSGFRNKKASSDHGKGMAADLQFLKHDKADYFEIVKWIRQNIPHKQLLLEYEERSKGRIAWIHIAYDKQGTKNPMSIATLFNHSIYSRDTFVNLG